MTADVKELTDEQIRERIIRLAFDGERQRFEQFCARMRAGLPRGTGVVLRGSALTNERWEDGSPFDAAGHGTSDLDITLVGSDVMDCWVEDEFYIPGLHTKPLGDECPEIAPALNSLREELQRIARRPVHFQATANLILYARDVLFSQPYFTLIEPEADAPSSDAGASS
jgi:hypothetical protein